MALHRAARVVERELRVYRRLWRASLVTNFLTPVLYLAAIGLGLGGIVDARNHSVSGTSYLAFVAPGLLAAGAMQSASAESLWPVMSGFKWMRHFHAMAAAAPTPADIYDGYLGWIAVRVAASATAFLIVAAALGGVKSPWGVFGIPAATLGALAVAAPVVAFAATQDSDALFPVIMRLAVFPLFLFSGTFFPVVLLPHWARALVVLSPLWHAVELCRAATTGRVGWIAVAHVAVLVAFVAVGALWGRRTFRRRLTP